jgi:hypothetical protein
MQIYERRRSPRFPYNIPVRFTSLESPSDEEISTRAINISQSGMLLSSPQPLAIGSVLSMAVRVPTEISGSVFGELRCVGRVIREHGTIDGVMRYGIEISAATPCARERRMGGAKIVMAA